jgi:DNA-binding transcriptional regulator LsrR (DeoR family)
MTPDQFATIADLLDSRGGPAEQAARLVLLDGVTQADAARQTGIKPPSVSKVVARYREVAARIAAAW